MQWSHGRLGTRYYLSICRAFRLSQLHKAQLYNHSSSSESYLTSCTSLNYTWQSCTKSEQNTAVHIQSRGVGNSRNIKMVVDLGVRPQLIPPQPPPSICNASKHTDTHTHTNTYTNKHTYAYTHAHNVQTGGRREN